MFISEGGGGSGFEQAAIGTHVARCVKIIDIGTHKGDYQGQVTIKRQVIIGWELPNELITKGEYAGKPFFCSKFYTASLNEKAALRADLTNWRTRDFTQEELMRFDLKSILDKACMISITRNDKDKSKVSGVMSLPKGMVCPDRVNDLVNFSLDEYDQNVFDLLSPGYKKMIMESPEYIQIHSPKHDYRNESHGNTVIDAFDDDLPF